MLRSFMSRAAALVTVLVALNAFNAHAQTVTVVEYYNKVVDAYFITGRTNEQTALDGVADFQRTGMTFQATAAATAPASGAAGLCEPPGFGRERDGARTAGFSLFSVTGGTPWIF